MLEREREQRSVHVARRHACGARTRAGLEGVAVLSRPLDSESTILSLLGFQSLREDARLPADSAAAAFLDRAHEQSPHGAVDLQKRMEDRVSCG
jgi:hypothetical protein